MRPSASMRMARWSFCSRMPAAVRSMRTAPPVARGPAAFAGTPSTSTGAALNRISASASGVARRAAASAASASAIKPFELLADDPVVLHGLVVHPPDRRPGQDVVELLKQHGLPRLAQLVVRVRVPQPDGRRRTPQFGFVEQRLAPPVAALGARLRRVGSAVEFEVQLAGPHGRLREFRARRVEELGRRRHPHRRRAVEGPGAACGRDHLAGRAAASVAEAERHERGVRPALVGEVLLRPGEVRAREHRVVGVDRREVREDARAVDALPEEGVVRKAVGLVPRDLLREEVLGACGSRDLRDGGREAEGVGQPHLARVHPELVAEESRPLDELPHQRLAADQVRVGLDPHPADRHEPTLGDARPGCARRAQDRTLHPRVLLRRRRRRTRSPGPGPSGRARSRRCGRPCGSSRAPATATPNRCGRDRRRRRGGRSLPRARRGPGGGRRGPARLCRRRRTGRPHPPSLRARRTAGRAAARSAAAGARGPASVQMSCTSSHTSRSRCTTSIRRSA